MKKGTKNAAVATENTIEKSIEESMKSVKTLSKKGLEILAHRIDAMIYFSVENANPNGDPNFGNGGPRLTSDGRGLITDVCIKHWIRVQLYLMGYPVLVLPDDMIHDGCKSISERLAKNERLQAAIKANDFDLAEKIAAETWIDVRMFGALLPIKNVGSISVKAPVSVELAKSVGLVNVVEHGITKCLSYKQGSDSDRMGSKSLVEFGLYGFGVSISPYKAEQVGFTNQDAEILHEALKHLFDETDSAARPVGSMNVESVYWWNHDADGDGKLPRVPAKIVRDSVQYMKKGDEFEHPHSMKDFELVTKKIDGIVEPDVYAPGQQTNA